MKIFNKTILLFVLGIGLILSTVVYQSCCRAKYCLLFDDLYASIKNDTILVKENDTVHYDKLNLQVLLNQETIYCKNSNFSFITKATAFTCKPDISASYKIDSVKSFNIISNEDYDSSHLKGSSLNDLFNIPSTIKDSFYNDYYRNDTLHFSLSKAPTLSTKHKLRIKLEMYNSLGYDTILPSLIIIQ